MKVRTDGITHFGELEAVGQQDVTGNGVRLNSAATAVAPIVSAVGDDTNVSLSLAPKGTAQVIATTNICPKLTVTTEATVGAVTYTAAQLLGGLILRDPNGAGRSDVTPTAALIVAAIPGCAVGTAFEFEIRNTADAAETITVTAGTTVTLSGTMTIAQNNTKRFLAVITAVGTPAVTIYSRGTVVF